MSVLRSLFGGRGRRQPGRHTQSGPLPAQTILPGRPAPYEPALHQPAPYETASASPIPVQIPAEPGATADTELPEAGPRVGLFFGDGSHVFMEADDPRAGAFAAIADKLSH